MSLGSVNVGSGDMYSAVYDPAGGERQVAFADDLTDKMDKVNPTGSGHMTIGTRAEGSTVGDGSIVIGEDNVASAEISTAFGYHTQATAEGAFAQGAFGKASGRYAVVHGTRVTGQRDPEASGEGAMSNGSSSLASGHSSHAEGYVTEASGTAAHSEGIQTAASGSSAHAEGNQTAASGPASHAEGVYTKSSKPAQHASGIANVEDTGTVSGHYPSGSVGSYIEIVGNGEVNSSGTVTKRSNARALDWDGNERLHGDLYVNCEDDSTGGSKVATETELTDKMDKVNPTGSGHMTIGTRAGASAAGRVSLALGYTAEASGDASLSIGNSTKATGQASFAHGAFAEATGQASFAHGAKIAGVLGPTVASGAGSTALGGSVKATGHYSFAEGYAAEANGIASIAEGMFVTANQRCQIARGVANVPDAVGTYIEIVGNGELGSDGLSVETYSNARTLDWSGNERLHGDLYVNCEDDSTGGSKVATETQVNAKYTKPSSGIPKTDLASAVQTSLGYADTFNTVKPDGATAQNKLVTASQMGDAIEAVEAKQLYATNAQGSFATKAALTGATVFYNADGTAATPTKNDVAYILADESHSGKSAKYVIANEPTSSSDIVWGFVITFSDTTFSQAQMDAINSGINETKRSGYDSHVASSVIHVPVCTTADNGKFLRVVNGVPAWVSIPTMEGGSY